MPADHAAPPTLVDHIRASCAWVAERAAHVAIDGARIAAYARELPRPAREASLDPKAQATSGPPEQRAAFVLCLDAINFGSGWWPTIRKRPGCSGYQTMASGLGEQFARHGAWTADQLSAITAEEIAAVLDQEPEHELMGHYAAALRDLGAHVARECGGRFLAVPEQAGDSGVALAQRLAGWACFADVSRYRGRDVPLFKRAQLTAADLQRAGVARFTDLERLTAFADNLVPHVLGLDGVLRLDAALAARIERGELLVHGSPEEVELRACTVHAIELLAGACELTPAEIDEGLWNRGQQSRYKAHPRPRSRTTAY